MTIKTAIGLMSGTSMDGIDVAMIRTDGQNLVTINKTLAMDYSPQDRNCLEQAMEDAKTIGSRKDRPGCLQEVEQLVTKRHGEAVIQFLKHAGLLPQDVDVIGFHGQTVLHRPDNGLTVQLGLGEELAKLTGIDVVYDMRAADMVAGGQGAPLVPVFHQALAKELDVKLPLVFVNIGGISNITYLDEKGGMIAFDTGPGNALIDQWVATHGGIPFDQGGAIASEGRVIMPIVEEYLSAPFFDQDVPKSLDRNDFSPLMGENAELSDGARTLAYVTAAAIFKSTEHLPQTPKTWIVCGGGRLNDTIVTDMRIWADADEAKLLLCEDVGLSGDMLEAQAFAYLAVRSLAGLPLTFPTTTACTKPVSGGVLAKATNN